MPVILGRNYDGDFGSYIEELIFDFEPDEALEDDAYELYKGELVGALEDCILEDGELTDEEIEFLEDHAEGGVIIETDENGEVAFLWFKDSEILEEAWEARREGGIWEEGGDEDDDIEFLEEGEEEEDEDEEEEEEESDEDSDDGDDSDEDDAPDDDEGDEDIDNSNSDFDDEEENLKS